MSASNVRRIASFLRVIAFAAVVSPGCVPPGTNPPGPRIADKGLVGSVQETDAILGVLIDGDHVVGYVCDGIEGSDSIAGWYEGALVDDAFELIPISGTSYEGRRSSGRLRGRLTDGGAEGTYDAGDGIERTWSAALAREDAAAGLYLLSDGDDLVSVVVDNTDALKGLSRSRTTGWTTRVEPAGALQVATTQETQVPLADAVVIRQVLLVTKPLDVIRVIVPPPDPGPATGAGTLMIHVIVSNEKVIGYRYALLRPDELGIPTLKLTGELVDTPAQALAANMKVAVLDGLGKVVSTHFVPDPISSRLEVPPDPKSGADAFWTQRGEPVASFLVAVPNVAGASRVVFTRYTSSDRPLDGGVIDLKAKPLDLPGRAVRIAQSFTGYDAADAEHETIINNGPPENRMDLLILAEGFVDTNADRDLFRNVYVPALLEQLWTIPTYNEIRSSINVHVAYVPSRESGSGIDANHLKDTPYQTFFNHNGLPRLLGWTFAGEAFAYEVAAGAPGNYGGGSVDAIAILVNSPTYGGAGGSLLTVSVHPSSSDILSHELAHVVVDLADEYETIYNDAAVANARLKPNCSGPVEMPSQLKWSDLVAPTTAIPTELDNGNCVRVEGCFLDILPPGTAGMYEGAGYVACGSFRPTHACRMRCFSSFFCPVCQRAFRETFAPYLPNAVDVFIRDNIMDFGDPPSPVGTQTDNGIRVWSWESPDILVDAPPFHGDLSQPHEAPVPGEVNRVYVTVTNRGIGPAPANVEVDLWFARGTVGSPLFPGPNWTPVGTQSAVVPPFFGRAVLTYNWTVPAGLDPNVQFLALARAAGDELVPASLGGMNLNDAVRYHNNVARRNQYPITLPVLSGEIVNHEKEIQPIVLRLSFPQAPLGTTFTLGYENTVTWSVFEPGAPPAFPVSTIGPTKAEFQCTAAGQQYVQLRGNLPAGADEAPFVNRFVLEVAVPGGAPITGTYTITFTQYAVDAASDLLGEVLGGEGYMITFN